MKYKDIVKVLRKKGYKQSTRKTRGSHRVWYHPETRNQASIPDFGARDLPKGTLHAIKKQLDIEF